MMCDSDVRLNQNVRSKNVDSSDSIKKELDVAVNIKPEPAECILCSNREGSESYDIHRTSTAASGTVIYEFLFRLTNVRFVETRGDPKHVCKSCCDLINVLEQAEIEYVKVKQTFDAIVSKNPLFESHDTVGPVELDKIKNEYDPYSMFDVAFKDVDSEDEPLANSKKKQKVEKRKKKPSSSMSKQKPHNKSNKDSWDCQVCGEHGDSGGKLAETAHTLAVHNAESAIILDRCVKEEDGSDNTDYDNIAGSLEITFDLENSSNYGPRVGIRKRNKNSCPQSVGTQKKSCLKNVATQKKKRKKVDKKIMHQCDQCDAKYPTQFRLKRHKESHEAAKPPFICEVCGARYKHKRACDIHVDLHKGISDWKCEECNKLFPSKGALHRHNNIHTGNANYQCDLCGKSFIHTSSFKMHKLAHSGVKPHSCRVCGLALMTRSHLKRHERVHSGEKRHECDVCGKRFSERYNLVAHSKSHSPGAPPPEPQPPRRRTFRCPYCHERFERRYMLERHTALAHGRAMERPPPTPRNTMSKLLKAQAQARHPPAPTAPTPAQSAPTSALPAPPPLTPAPASRPRSPPDTEAHVKDDPSPERQSAPSTPQKLPSQLISSSSLVSVSGSWSTPFAADFALRNDFQH